MRKLKKEETQNVKTNEEVLQNDEKASETKKAEFEKLISEEYQKEFKEKILEILNDETLSANDDEKENTNDIIKRIEALEEKLNALGENLNEGKNSHMEKTVKLWMDDASALKETYPDFDLQKESEREDFINLLKGGVNLKNAYLALHHDDILTEALKKAKDDATKQAIDQIRIKSERPLENGTSGKIGSLFSQDVSRLTKAQREEIAKRVARGEIISF